MVLDTTGCDTTELLFCAAFAIKLYALQIAHSGG
jgi:hypothetical protein